MRNSIIIGSRASKLALVQANLVADKLKILYPETEFEIKTIKTTGDKIPDVALNKIGDKGLFTKEIEDALLKGEIDFAVHSMKDLPVELPPDLKIAAVTQREDPRDALVYKEKGLSLTALPKNSKVGTSSLRRSAQLLHIRNDLRVLDLRGNLDTRIKKLEQGLYTAVILAYAGIKRLGLKVKFSLIPIQEMLPQAGQGALGIEIRSDNQELDNLLKVINDDDSGISINAERAVLSGLGGGCQAPIGVYAYTSGNRIYIRAGVFSLDGKTAVIDEISGNKKDAENSGRQLAQRMMNNGDVRLILNEVGKLLC